MSQSTLINFLIKRTKMNKQLIKHNGGSIMLGWKNNRKKYELFFSIRPSIKEGVYIALVFNDSIRYDKNGDYKLNNNYDLLFEVMNDLSKFINEEMNLKTTKIEISKI